MEIGTQPRPIGPERPYTFIVESITEQITKPTFVYFQLSSGQRWSRKYSFHVVFVQQIVPDHLPLKSSIPIQSILADVIGPPATRHGRMHPGSHH